MRAVRRAFGGGTVRRDFVDAIGETPLIRLRAASEAFDEAIIVSPDADVDSSVYHVDGP